MNINRERGAKVSKWTAVPTEKEIFAVARLAGNDKHLTLSNPTILSIEMGLKDGEHRVVDVINEAGDTIMTREILCEVTEGDLMTTVKLSIDGFEPSFVKQYEKTERGMMTNALYVGIDHFLRNTIAFATADGTEMVKEYEEMLRQKIEDDTADKKAKERANEELRAERAKIRQKREEEIRADREAKKRAKAEERIAAAKAKTTTPSVSETAKKRASKKAGAPTGSAQVAEVV